MINVIEAIEEKLQAQKEALHIKDLNIQALKDELEDAKKKIASLKGGAK